MVITYYGLSCFKISSGEFVLAFDPPSKKSSFKSPRFRAEVVLVSHDHDDHNGYDMISGKENEEPLKVNGPGEYETKGVFIRGFDSFHDSVSGKKHGRNSIYTVELEDMKLCHFGDFGEKELSAQTLESIGQIDVLFLPVGGGTVIEAENAAKISNQLEPKIIIPMHYEKKELNSFLKEMGAEDAKAEEKLTLKKKDLPEDKTSVVVLKPQLQ
ncbi:MAG: MBL fold metallo-hydrolase [Candidatus Niyogibacteria bacterium]|nr:MBL fold metallo-hydrolase [Candidatus Niyogibacteria bacterium]